MEQKITAGQEERTLLEFAALFKELYHIGKQDIRSYSPLTLAYLGDAVFELIVRSYVVGQGNTQAEKLHKHTSTIVNAAAQSDLIRVIEEDLTTEEAEVYKRGRNARSYTKAKNASTSDYRRATGLEALIGWLFLEEKYERLISLVQQGLSRLEYL